VAATAFLTFYLLLGIGGPLLDELTHAAVESSERATVLSVRSMVFQLGGMTASLSLGVLAGATTFTIAFATLTVILALGSMTLVRMPQAKPARTDTVSQMAH
jgi:hypothetical protein